MTTLDFSGLVSHHRKYFHTGITRSVEWRESQLTALRTMMKERDEEIDSKSMNAPRFPHFKVGENGKLSESARSKPTGRPQHACWLLHWWRTHDLWLEAPRVARFHAEQSGDGCCYTGADKS